MVLASIAAGYSTFLFIINQVIYDLDKLKDFDKNLKKFVKDEISMNIKSPIIKTCEAYYKQGCTDTSISFIFELVIAAMFGFGLSLIITPFYGIGIILTIAATLVAIGYIIKKKKFLSLIEIESEENIST